MVLYTGMKPGNVMDVSNSDVGGFIERGDVVMTSYRHVDSVAFICTASL